MKFLITGITGFAGPHLANLLHKEGHKIYGLIRRTNGMESDIRDVVSDEVYNERVSICNACDKFDKNEVRCTECGCFIPAKAKVILDSCPLDKWGTDIESWEKKFEGISEKLDKNNN